jgi:chemotaxis signal transduction protein
MANNNSGAVEALPLATTARYGFMVDGLRLVPQENMLTEVLADIDVSPVPLSANALIGVLNLRGTIVPLFDAAKFAKPARTIRPTHCQAMVFDSDEARIGLLLNSAPQLVVLSPMPADTVRPNALLTNFLLQPWAQANDPSKIWWEFDHRAAFAALAHK